MKKTQSLDFSYPKGDQGWAAFFHVKMAVGLWIFNLFIEFFAYKSFLSDPKVFDECDISDAVKEKLLDEIRKKLTPQALKIRTDIEVSCFSYEGIEAVKAALMKGKECSTEEIPIKVQKRYLFFANFSKNFR